MRYSRSAITQLTKWYKSVLIKCALLNAAFFVSMGAVNANASAPTITNGDDAAYTWKESGANTGIKVNVDETDYYVDIKKTGYIDASGEQTLNYSWDDTTKQLTVTKSGTAVKTDGVEYVGNTGTWGSVGNYSSGTIDAIAGDFVGNSATKEGGAIYATGSSQINGITGSFIGNRSNSGSFGGGAIFHNSSNSIGTITGDFIGNYAVYSGGAIHNTGNSNINSITGDFIGNKAAGIGNGGAIYNNVGRFNSITGNFIANSANQGGAIFNVSQGKFDNITGDFIGNSATKNGGAVYTSGYNTYDYTLEGYTNFVDSSFINNTAEQGAAIYANAGKVRVTAKNKNIEFTNNIATGSGTKEGYGIYLTAYTNFDYGVSSVLELNANSGKKITINDTIYSKNVGCPDDGKVVINNDPNYNSGTVIFNNKFDIDRMEIYGGTTAFGTGTAATSLTKAQYLEVYGGTLSFANNNIDTLVFGEITDRNSFNLAIDVDAGEIVTADKINASLYYSSSSPVYLSVINFINSTAESGEVQIADGNFRYGLSLADDVDSGIYATVSYDKATGILSFANPISWLKPTFGSDSAYKWTQTNTGIIPTVYKPGTDEEKTFYLSIQKKTYVDANGDEQTLTYGWEVDEYGKPTLTTTRSDTATSKPDADADGNYSGSFIGNAIGNSLGGAINNGAVIESVSGDFIDNSALGSSSDRYGSGGAIYNTGTINTVSGNFINNLVQGRGGYYGTAARGGAIFNNGGTINSLSGSFIGNGGYGAYDGGAVYNNNQINTITGEFIGNTVSRYGGAIYNEGTITTVNADFIGNNANSSGGAIYNIGTMTNISGKFIRNGGYKYLGSTSIYNRGTIENLNADFISNEAYYNLSYDGGTIYNQGTIKHITGNFIGNKGNVIYNYSDDDNLYYAKVESIDGTFIDNGGTAISNSGRGAAVELGTINGTFTHNGQGIITGGSNIESITGTFTNNGSENLYDGGAINIGGGTIKLINADFIGNTAQQGGAIQRYDYYGQGKVVSLNGDFTGNRATSGGGGAIVNIEGKFENITGNFTDNTANSYGGAIYNGGDGRINITNSLFTGNTATKGGAISNVTSSNGDYPTVTITDTSFIGNKATNGAALYQEEFRGSYQCSTCIATTSVIAKTKDVEFTNNNTTGTAEGTGNGIHIVNGVFNLNAASGKKITINDNVYLGGTLNINAGDENNSGSIIFNGSVGTNYKNAEFGGGNIKFAKYTDGLYFGTLTVSGDTTLDMQNNSAGELMYAGTLTGTGNLTFNVDYDASNGYMDYIHIDGGAGTVTLNAINILADGKTTSTRYLYFYGSSDDINVISEAIVAQTADYRYTFTPDATDKGRLNVTRTAFEATLADAIADATVSSYTMGSDFTFDENGQGILAGDGRNFTIFGQDHVIDGGSTYSHISTSAGQTLSIENATFQNMSPAISNQGNLNLKNVSFAAQDYTDVINNGTLNLDGTNTVNYIAWDNDNPNKIVNVNGGTTTVNGAMYQNELNVAEGATLILGNDYSSIQTAFDNKGTLQIDYQLNVYNGNLTNSGTISGDGRIVVGGGDSEAYLENTGTINNLLVVKNGTVKTAVENVTGTINNRGTLLLSGTLNKNIYKGSTSASKEGVIKIDGTLKIDASGAGDKTIYTSSIIDPNGGTLDMKNNQIDTLWVSSNKTTGTGNLTLDVDLSGETVKSDVFYATGSGSGSTNNDVLTVTDLGIIGELKPFETQILNGDVYRRSLLLDDAVAAKYNKTEISTRYESDDLTATASWDDTFNSKKYETETIKKLETYAADSYTPCHQGLRYTETTGEETLVEETPLGDTLVLLNQASQFGDTERKFITSDAGAVHNVTADLGTTAAGKLTVQGATNGENTSTIDFKAKNGFKISDGAEVVLDTVKLVGAKAEDGALIDNKSGTVSLRDAEVAENSKPTINNDSTMKLSGTNNIDSGIGGNGTTNITDGQTTLGAKLTQKKVNVKSGATLKANADNIDAPVANNGTYDVTGGTIGKDVTGGKLNVKGDVTVGDNADVSTKSANVAKGASLDVGTNSVDLGDAAIDGTVKLEITDIAASSNKYTGGQINAKSLNLGKDSKLSLTIAPNLIAKKTSTGALDIINVSGATTGQFAEMLSNNRYKLTAADGGGFVITNYASVADIINEAGGSTNNVAAGEAWDETSFIAGSKASEVQSVLNELSQHDEHGYVKALTDLAPTDSLVHVGITQDFNNLIGEQIAARLNREGLNSGDVFEKRGAWIQTLYNHSKQDENSKNQGFTGKTAGVALGLDGEIKDNLTVGLGYAYGKSDVDSAGRDIDIDGHTLYIYGKYQPSAWYIRGLAHYGFAEYEEKANIAGIANKAKYDVHNYGARAFVGYDMPNGFTPEAGLRLTRIDRKNYTDSFGQHVKSDGIDVLTASLGMNYSTNFAADSFIWSPKAHIAATYDLLSDDSSATVTVGNGLYNIEGKKLHRLGAEAGIGVEISVGNWEFSAEYDLGARKDYLSHTGMLKAKYNF
ncbi:MAG: autotransporter domain-containing protein [Alphaproteobacteria bacterium]|nr:autotransporter domain-containing protein [Alphaproteobacteria bacterium]